MVADVLVFCEADSWSASLALLSGSGNVSNPAQATTSVVRGNSLVPSSLGQMRVDPRHSL